MKIAFILPSLNNTGPILVAQDIINSLSKLNVNILVDVYYFDKTEEALEFNCNLVKRIDFKDKNIFSDYDLIHSHCFRSDFYVWKNKLGYKAISTQHNIIIKENKIRFNIFFAKIIEFFWFYILKNNKAVVSISGEMRKYHLSKLNNNIIYTVLNGRKKPKIENNNYNFYNDIADLKKHYKLIGSCASATKRKGHSQIIKALPFLEDYYFILIGSGDHLEDLKNLAKKLKVFDRCLFLGYKKDALTYLSFFDLFILPSYSEGMSLALLEAAAIKVPIICSNIEANKGMFSDQEVVFFELDNIEDLIYKTKFLYQNKCEFAKRANDKYNNYYTADIMALNYLKLYKLLLKNE